MIIYILTVHPSNDNWKLPMGLPYDPSKPFTHRGPLLIVVVMARIDAERGVPDAGRIEMEGGGCKVMLSPKTWPHAKLRNLDEEKRELRKPQNHPIFLLLLLIINSTLHPRMLYIT